MVDVGNLNCEAFATAELNRDHAIVHRYVRWLEATQIQQVVSIAAIDHIVVTIRSANDREYIVVCAANHLFHSGTDQIKANGII